MALLLCERQQNWLKVVTVVFRTIDIYVITSTFFYVFYVFFKIQKVVTFYFFWRVSYVFSNYGIQWCITLINKYTLTHPVLFIQKSCQTQLRTYMQSSLYSSYGRMRMYTQKRTQKSAQGHNSQLNPPVPPFPSSSFPHRPFQSRPPCLFSDLPSTPVVSFRSLPQKTPEIQLGGRVSAVV